jgi:hypothetical protein
MIKVEDGQSLTAVKGFYSLPIISDGCLFFTRPFCLTTNLFVLRGSCFHNVLAGYYQLEVSGISLSRFLMYDNNALPIV